MSHSKINQMPVARARGILRVSDPLEKRGHLIVCEGLDGSGKSSVMSRLRQYFEESGQTVVISNWNDTTELYNLVMRMSLSGDLDDAARCLFSAGEMAARCHYIVFPALRAGKTVFMTKYLVSAFAHALIRSHDVRMLSRAYEFAPEPDLTLYVDIPPKVALERKLSYRGVAFWEAGMDLAEPVGCLEDKLAKFESGAIDAELLADSFAQFQGRLRVLHKELLQGTRTAIINGDQNADEVFEDARVAVQNALSGKPKEAVTNWLVERHGVAVSGSVNR